MARATRDIRLETRTARLKLPIGDRHSRQVSKGVALIYRRTTDTYGTWSARVLKVGGGHALKYLGDADDTADANGATVLDYFQAQQKCREMANEIRLGAKDSGGPLTVADAARNYMDWFRQHRKGVSDTQTAINAHILPTFGKKLVCNLTSREIQQWLDKLATSPVRRRTKLGCKQAFDKKPMTEEQKRARKSSANRTLARLKAMLNKAWHDGLVSDKSAWERVKPYSCVDEPVVRFLSKDESGRLINACQPDFRLLVRGALHTGARYGELAKLRVSHVSLDTARSYIQIMPSKSGKPRYVPLNSEGAALFRALIAGKSGDALVFTREDGNGWGKGHQVRPLEEANKQGKIVPQISFHELRHTYASLMAQAGADLLTISKLLGHADTRITSRHYAHLCDATLSNAVDRFLPNFGYESGTKVVAIR